MLTFSRFGFSCRLMMLSQHVLPRIQPCHSVRLLTVGVCVMVTAMVMAVGNMLGDGPEGWRWGWGWGIAMVMVMVMVMVSDLSGCRGGRICVYHFEWPKAVCEFSWSSIDCIHRLRYNANGDRFTAIASTGVVAVFPFTYTRQHTTLTPTQVYDTHTHTHTHTHTD